MKNEYKVIDYSELGLPCIEIYGGRFHYQDLYELVGKNQFMTTFNLRRESESYKEFGGSVLGVIYYDRKSLDALEESNVSGREVAEPKIRIDSPHIKITEEKRCDLKYSGINIDDIENVSFLPYKRETETYETGEKKVPDIIEIKADCRGLDVDTLNQNYLASKHNSGKTLIQHEKEQLIGITLAFNKGKIDSRILDEFGFNEDDLKTNLNIWMSLYKVKERRSQLTDIDKKNHDEIKSLLSLEKFTKVVKELGAAGMPPSWGASETLLLKKIFKAVEEFSPSILMHGKKQVYWDLDSYIHIALRHLKDHQLGNFALKTPFLYRSNELESLIKKVLSRLEEEIRQYLTSSPESDFTRNGKMAVFYNGDHYHLRINPEGRLAQFHMVGSTFNKSMRPTTKASAD